MHPKSGCICSTFFHGLCPVPESRQREGLWVKRKELWVKIAPPIRGLDYSASFKYSKNLKLAQLNLERSIHSVVKGHDVILTVKN